HFSEIHNRAIDEIWYKRAVDYHFIQPHSYVYSVPYEAGDKNGTLVTASYAIFHTKPDDDWKAPAAVIGFQFRHSALHRMLFNITSTCPDCPDKHNNKTCASNELECYVVDNNGYVVVAESLRDTGKFFGEIRASVMEEMVNRNMFKRIRIFDYQAVCFRPKSTGNCASYFVTVNIIYSEEGEDDNGSSEMGMNENNKGNEKQYERWTINRTRPQPCDKEVVLYQMNPRAIQENKEPFDSVKCKRFFEVQVIDQSNLILVVVDKVCTPDESEKLSVAPVEVFYNTSSLACFKVENMQRRQRPRSCISHHRDEDKIELCGGCGTVHLNLILLLSSWFTIYIADFC
ncbi:Voltage-dependent calcium channel subunit alpha-2/delta-3, partial [Gryllus bimaculatus]